MINNKWWLIVMLLAISIGADAQGKLNLMNGQIFEFDSIGKAPKNKYVYVCHENKKHYSIAAKRIFSILYPDGMEEILFKQDSLISDLTVPQMKDFVKGEQDCWNYYKPKMVTVGGLVIGAGAGFLDFYGPLFPAAFALIETVSSPPDIFKQPYADKAFTNNEFYAYGFEIAAKKKKFKNAIYGGGIGFAASFIAIAIISNHHH